MGRHPQRTPFYGVLMLLVAMLGGFAVQQLPHPALRVLGYIALVAIGLVGFVLTFRDYS